MIYPTGAEPRNDTFTPGRLESSDVQQGTDIGRRDAANNTNGAHRAICTKSIGVGTSDDDARTKCRLVSVKDPPEFHELSALDVLKNYSEEALVHGLHYVGKKDLSIVERLCWAFAVTVCGVFAILFVHIAWVKYCNSPIVTTVETTSYPLYKIPFPAISVCSTNNVRRTIGEKKLLRFLDEAPNDALLKKLYHVMSALSNLQYPFIYNMQEHLQATKDFLPRLVSFNISRFMLQVMPACEDMFEYCFWQGRWIDCCKVFHMQRYQGGFCYSFNSLTSEATKDCGTPVYSESLKPNSTVEDRPECLLYHNTASGPNTGLEVYLKHGQDEDQLGDGQRLGKGIIVFVHQPNDFPDEGRSLFIAERSQELRGVVKVSPSLTESMGEMRNLNPKVRHCYFPDEKKLLVGSDYSHQSCLLQCRLLHIVDKCHCLPYFFNTLPVKAPECNMTELECLMDHGVEMRFFRPPAGARGFKGSASKLGIDCSECLPTCHDSKYDLEASTSDSNKLLKSQRSYLDVYYKDLSAVKYRRELAFGQTELLVSLGGIVSLFLGVSLLSGVEFFYYIAKLIAALTCGPRRPKVMPSSEPQAHQAYYGQVGHRPTKIYPK